MVCIVSTNNSKRNDLTPITEGDKEVSFAYAEPAKSRPAKRGNWNRAQQDGRSAGLKDAGITSDALASAGQDITTVALNLVKGGLGTAKATVAFPGAAASYAASSPIESVLMDILVGIYDSTSRTPYLGIYLTASPQACYDGYAMANEAYIDILIIVRKYLR